jgi:hypothetical protein
VNKWEGDVVHVVVMKNACNILIWKGERKDHWMVTAGTNNINMDCSESVPDVVAEWMVLSLGFVVGLTHDSNKLCPSIKGCEIPVCYCLLMSKDVGPWSYWIRVFIRL